MDKTEKLMDQYAYRLDVMEAYTRGEIIEHKFLGGADCEYLVTAIPSWNWDSYMYRIKPEEKVRPWNVEEVPVSSIVYDINNPKDRYVITGASKNQYNVTTIELGGHGQLCNPVQMLNGYRMTDGSPCGVKI
jgi:hypothetical protein